MACGRERATFWEYTGLWKLQFSLGQDTHLLPEIRCARARQGFAYATEQRLFSTAPSWSLVGSLPGLPQRLNHSR